MNEEYSMEFMYEDELKRKQLQIDEYWELIEEQDIHIVELQERIADLEAQIEKMKCCENCAFQLVIGGVRDRHCVKCNACSEWELED